MNLDGEVKKNEAIRELRLGLRMRDWGAVLRTVRGLPPCAELWLAKTNKWADTVLHAAIIYGTPPRAVHELFEAMHGGEEDVLQIVSARNQWGNTPLHCAGDRGSSLLCRRILDALSAAQHRTRALLVRNNEGETPLFLAAVHGHLAAFLLLHGHAEPEHATAPYVKPNE
ncbi:NF-kappa-B inhibitor alpha-like [Neltuma alba]|uniref:NF-kappa-B inhibitor alpha-like n=1 Tax=Neltuma alba TaxID=207710 RepID=UPI0010A49CBF|nr:NF-kappa-B inhibitor alpha-like [Prosopis alba]